MDCIHAVHGQNQIGTGCGGVHIRGCVLSSTVPVAFIDILENNGRCHGAGDVCIVKNQIDHSFGITFGILPQIDTDLTGGQGTADPVGAGRRDVHHGMDIGLLKGMLILVRAFAIGISAFIGIQILIVHNVMAGENRRGLPAAIHGDSRIGQHNCHSLTVFRRGFFVNHACIFRAFCSIDRKSCIAQVQNRT